MICTTRSYNKCKEQIEAFFVRHAPQIRLRYHYVQNMEDIITEQDARSMKNLIYKTIYATANCKDTGKLYLCLSGGRKTMSSDFQQAAYLFGCQAMIHILADWFVDFDLMQDPGKLCLETINKINPVIYSGRIMPDYISYRLQEEVLPQRYETGRTYIHDYDDTLILDEVEKMQESQEYLVQNYSNALLHREASSQFRALMMLAPQKLEQLKIVCSAKKTWIGCINYRKKTCIATWAALRM